MSANWRAATRKFTGVPSLIPPGTLKLQPEDEIDGSFYVRFVVKDRAGIVGDIGQTFGRIGVNISEIWQLRHSEEELRSADAKLQAQAKAQGDFAVRDDSWSERPCGRCARLWIPCAIEIIS